MLHIQYLFPKTKSIECPKAHHFMVSGLMHHMHNIYMNLEQKYVEIYIQKLHWLAEEYTAVQ